MAIKRGGRNGRGGTSTPYEREAAYIDLLERMTNVVESMEQKQMAPALEQAPALQGPTTYDMFTAERAPGFLGRPNPTEVDVWIKRMKKIFDVLDCTDRERVAFATYKLEGEADSWWDMQKRAMGVPNQAITWAMFEDAFMEKYFPSSLRDQKEQEFMRLRQRNMTVKEYDAKFTELARFAPYYVEDEQRKAKKFLQGLRDDTRKLLSVLKFQTYAEILDRAAIYEKEAEAERYYAKRAASRAGMNTVQVQGLLDRSKGLRLPTGEKVSYRLSQ